MAQELDTALKEAAKGFDSIQTTETTRTGVDRRRQQCKEFPAADSKGNIIAEDRRIIKDRRSEALNIDDISEFVDDSD